MILGTVQLHLHENREERVDGLLPEYPCLTRRTELDAYAAGFLPWHWHEFFECLVVERGALELIVEGGVYRFGQGDGCFINADVLHCFRPADDQPGTCYHVHQFSRDYIAGLSLLERKCVAPVAACGALEVTPLYRDNERQAVILDLIERAYVCAGEEPYGFELSMRALLIQMWVLLMRETKDTIAQNSRVSSVESDRVKEMLTFMENNLAEPIGPREIAAAVNISVRECHRCFRKVLDTTPQAYLGERRISRALRLLDDTRDSITQIAAACGFASTSYFGKCFRDKMQCSPLAYRKARLQ